MHTRTQDAADASEASYIEAWAAVDGMGRTVVTLAEADPDPEVGDGHPWIVQGLTDYDAKGAARKAHLPWFWDGSDPQPHLVAFRAEFCPSPQGEGPWSEGFGRHNDSGHLLSAALDLRCGAVREVYFRVGTALPS